MSEAGLRIKELTPDEKLRLLEELWDSLAGSPEAVPLAEWQARTLDERLAEMDREGPSGIPWDQVLREVEGHRR